MSTHTVRWACWALALGLVVACDDGGSGEPDPGAPAGGAGGQVGAGGAGGQGGGEGGAGGQGGGQGGAEADAGMRPPQGPRHPNTQRQDQLFECDGTPGSSPVRVRRLNRIEWTRNVGQSASSPAARNPLDPDPGLLYPTFSEGVTLDAATVDQYLGINALPGGSWVEAYGNPRLDLVRSLRRDLQCFQNADNEPDAACVETFVRTLLERGVYFRPATEAEMGQLVAFAQQALAQEDPEGPGRADTITKITRAAWMTTGALFRTELGGPPEADGRRRLTVEEISLALAYGLSDRAPGAPTYVWYDGQPDGFLVDLRAAMLDGTIDDPEVIAGLVRRHIGGIDAGTLRPDEDPDELPAEIEALEGGERALAIDRRAGRVDVRQDAREGRRARRGEYWLSDKMRGFFRAWLGYAEVAAVFKDRPEATSRFDEGETSVYRPVLSAWNNALGGYYGHEPLLIELLDDTIARVVVEDTDVLARLLTTRQFYVPSSVSNPFGGAEVSGYLYDLDTMANPIEDNRASRWVTLPENQRAGVLTHPAWLAAHGGNFENDPSVIHRGKWVQEHLLCGLVPDVPITVDAQLDPETVHQSARARIQLKTEADQNCAGCHSLMNPLGYPFEIYNHAGYLRAEDHGGPPDGSSLLEYQVDPALDGPVTDAIDFSTRLASSNHVKRCFIRQSFRYFMGRAETPADACTLAAMETAYDRNDGSMIEMMVALFTSDAFLYRHLPEEETP